VSSSLTLNDWTITKITQVIAIRSAKTIGAQYTWKEKMRKCTRIGTASEVDTHMDTEANHAMDAHDHLKVFRLSPLCSYAYCWCILSFLLRTWSKSAPRCIDTRAEIVLPNANQPEQNRNTHTNAEKSERNHRLRWVRERNRERETQTETERQRHRQIEKETDT
jgi:hypothetical protein